VELFFSGETGPRESAKSHGTVGEAEGKGGGKASFVVLSAGIRRKKRLRGKANEKASALHRRGNTHVEKRDDKATFVKGKGEKGGGKSKRPGN